MLRTFLANGDAFDPEAAFIARSKVLEERRKAAAAATNAAGAVGAAGARRSDLARDILGPWERGIY